MLFNDGPEAAPFMVTVEMDGGHRMGGAEEQGGKEKLPFEVCGFPQALLLPMPQGAILYYLWYHTLDHAASSTQYTSRQARLSLFCYNLKT